MDVRLLTPLLIGWMCVTCVADVRTWTDSTGNSSVEAELVSVDGETVRLKRVDGSLITVPLSRLSIADQQFLRNSDPPSTEPPSTEPAPTEPAPTEPAPTEPAPTEPAPTSDIGTNGLPGMDLPLTVPDLAINSTGTHLVCAQVSNDMLQLLVIDLEQLKVVASTELDPRPFSIAVGSDAVYLINLATKEVISFSLDDLSEQHRGELPHKRDQLLVLGDQLLCSPDGEVRLDLPDLTPTTKWSRLGKSQGSRRPSVFRVPGGWHLDGMIYDDSLTKVRMIVATPLDSNQFEFKPRGSSYEYEQQLDRKNQLANYTVSPEHPVEVFAVVPRRPTNDEPFPVTLVAKHIGGETIDELSAGSVPNNYLRNVRRSHVHSGSNTAVPLIFAGGRVLFVLEKRLSIWDLGEESLAALSEPLAIELTQSTLVANLDGPTNLTHAVVNGSPPVKFRFPPQDASESAELSLAPATICAGGDTEKLLDSFVRRFDMHSAERFEKHRARMAPFVLRALGRTSDGIIGTYKVGMEVTDSAGQKVPHRYYLVVEVPQEVHGPYFAGHWRSVAVAKMKRNSEQFASLQDSQREAAAEWQQVTDAPLYNTLAYGIPFALMIPLWVSIALGGRRERTSRRRLRGGIIAGVGLASLIVLPIVRAASPDNYGLFSTGVFLYVPLMLVTGAVAAIVDYTTGYQPR